MFDSPIWSCRPLTAVPPLYRIFSPDDSLCHSCQLSGNLPQFERDVTILLLQFARDNSGRPLSIVPKTHFSCLYDRLGQRIRTGHSEIHWQDAGQTLVAVGFKDNSREKRRSRNSHRPFCGALLVKMIPGMSAGLTPMIERKSLCLSSPQPGIAAHHGDQDFAENVKTYCPVPENNAAEELVALKAELKAADTETFWTRLMEGMTELCQAQYGFVAKRILVDDHDSAIEMPQIGTPGSCLLGVAFYYNDGLSPALTGMHRDYKYLAWGAPCAHMRHDKVFLIPEKLSSFITNNPNAFPFPTEAYLGVPLFSQGKCFAHFGLMWSQEGLAKKSVSWTFMELLLHSLEDLILERLLAGQGFAKTETAPKPGTRPKVQKVIPQEAITASQSLKPYARSLSHELRTPMQGVVGMLDVMHATVQEAIEGQPNTKIRHIFQALRDNIEVVQDSSRRAVEAADNVVHAYDLNMQVPDTPQNDEDSPLNLSSTAVFEKRPDILIEGSNIPVNPYKRRRSSPLSWQFGSTTKRSNIRPSPLREASPREIPPVTVESETPLRRSPEQQMEAAALTPDAQRPAARRTSTRQSLDIDAFPVNGMRSTRIRELIPTVIHESLRVGGRPDSAIADPTLFGEQIDVRMRRASGGGQDQKMIEWTVHPDVPEYLLVDERDLAKLISCVFLNAVKFTETGKITVTVSPARNSRFISISVVDTGVGMPREFLPELFKPFSREDDSLTRSTEGLGLGLLVAKGLARKIGGDLELIRSETSGDTQGSEFEMRVPISSFDGSSRPSTPMNRTPTPSRGESQPGSKAGSYHSKTATSKAMSPLLPTSPPRNNRSILPPFPPPLYDEPLSTEIPTSTPPRRPSPNTSTPAPSTTRRNNTFDRKLAQRYPLTFLVAEDNKINRTLLVSMLGKFGYKDIYEAFDGSEAVRIMTEVHKANTEHDSAARAAGHKPRLKPVDVILMDLWMPEVDGYEATEKIVELYKNQTANVNGQVLALQPPTILAVSADVTDEAISRATTTGMEGYMTKPYKLMDLQRLIEEFCGRKLQAEGGSQAETASNKC